VNGRHGWRKCLPTTLKPRERIVAVEQSRFAAEARALDFEQAELGRDAAPVAENPPALPAAAVTRWHGTMTANGFRPSAWPTRRAALGSPSLAAMSP
jgi:hypothetical protein